MSGDSDVRDEVVGDHQRKEENKERDGKERGEYMWTAECRENLKDVCYI